jgi:hypothetical protein
MRILIGAAASLVLTACGNEAASPPEPQPTPSGTDYRARIEALPAGQRDAVMLRAVRDAGQDCQAVVGTAAAGAQFGMPSWIARCSDGRDWMVMIRADGTALVAPREEKPGTSGA